MIDAMKKAREALELSNDNASLWDEEREQCNEAIKELSAAIEAAERAEPVASIKIWEHRGWKYAAPGDYAHLPEGTHMLYAHPTAITADMVERAAKTLADLNYPVSGWPSGFDAAFQAHFRKHARAALEAALGGNK